ncbi:permease [Sansalvadorimonas sp. 2012CJ34-2]|uniref:Permease n=1 Tax=Parendozoicomonas callyspongiae TaxID=2942213 RepID=A0ABT0PEN6_9GAMM|nr:permease [Sansalvadorimonas sp. 2012CJ34-2]MCL6269671.1 permease [Sansalvadorimonas sp. 2012CJ34-2]
MTPGTRAAEGFHFFVEDTTKILFLLSLLIYAIALVRAGLNPEKVRYYLHDKNRYAGYFLGSTFGAITPFCSCSSIPLFMGFVSARIPLGVTMAFLLTSPMINEIAVVLLGSLLGIKFTVMYVIIGMSVGILGGFLIDLFKAERWLVPFLAKRYLESGPAEDISYENIAMSLQERHEFAKDEAVTIFKRIWKWVIIGVGIGAFIHGFIPESWVHDHLGAGQWWSVPVASLMAIPMYVNSTSIIPIMNSLLTKGVPLGTTLAFCMSAVVVSLPEFMMLKQVMSYRLLAWMAAYLLTAFCLLGWFFNAMTF